MGKNKKKDLILDEYEENDSTSIYDIQKDNDSFNSDNYYYEDELEDENNKYDSSDYIEEVNYSDEYDDYSSGDTEEYEEFDEEDKSDIISTISLVSIWFTRFGIVVTGILVLYFLFSAKFSTLLIYLISLVLAFFFGYVFMYLLEKFTEDN